jgi:anti-sigma factor RsiW
MKSEWKQLNLVDYLSGNLEEDEKARVEAALEEDAALRSELALMRREIQLMRSAGHDPHSDIRVTSVQDGVMNRIRQEKRSPVLFNSTWLSYFRAVGVVLVLIVVLALFFILRPRDEVELRSETEQNNQAIPVPAETTRKPVTLQMTTSKPNIKIQWKLDPSFPEMD